MSLYDTTVAALARPAFTLTGTRRTCTTRAQFNTALSAYVAGDWVECVGITFTGEVVFSKQLAGYAQFTFDSACKFTGVTSSGDFPAIWLTRPAFLQLIFNGCEVTNPLGDQGILMHGGDHVVIDGFKIHNCGGTGLDCFPVASDGADIKNCFFRGEVYNVALNNSWDHHAEKGTGLHCAHAGDGHTAVYHHNTMALYGHDVGPTGGGSVVEVGDTTGANAPHDNVFYIKALNMTMDAQSQVAGNAVVLWGANSSGPDNNDFKIIEATNCHGRAVEQNGAGGATWNNVRVDYGRANQCCLNPRLATNDGGIPGNQAWDPRHNIIYGDVQTNTGTGGGGLANTFGRSTIGASFTSLGQGYLIGNVFQAPPDVGTLTKMSAYLKGGNAAQVVRATLYNAVASGPRPGVDAAVDASAEVTIAAGQAPGWVDFTFSTPITPGAYYHLGIWSGATDMKAQIAYDGIDTSYWGTVAYASTGSQPSPYAPASSGAATAVGLSVYATYNNVVVTDTTPPHLLDASATAGTLSLLFDEALDPAQVPAGSAFTVKRNGGAADAAPTSVSLNGQIVSLRLATTLTPTDTVTVAYTSPGGATALQDAAGNDVVSFGDTAADNFAARFFGSGRNTAIARTVNPAGRVAGLGGGGI